MSAHMVILSVACSLLCGCVLQHASAVGPILDLPEEASPLGDVPLAAERLEDDLFRAGFRTMGTRCELLFVERDEDAARALVEEARAELLRLDASFSEWRSDSPISRINANAGVAPVEVPFEVFQLVQFALAAADRSGGSFEPTWAGMRHLWKFGDAQDGSVPTEEEVAAVRPLVDHRKVRLDERANTVFLEEEGMALGLGGIAKGYAVDRLAALFRERGASDFLIQLGGDLYGAGRRGDRSWMVGIRHPREPGRLLGSLPLEDQAFSTSGDYERFFLRDGVRYHHIIDPSTGWPATSSRSVTALCPDATVAEVVTKPVFILGPEKGIPFALAHGCEVAIVDASGELHLSPGLSGRLQGIPTSGAPASR